MKDIKKIHESKCPKDHGNEIQLSLDGVQESKSSSQSVDIFSVSFKNCHKVYPLRIIRPINKYKYDEQAQIKNVILDISACTCIISETILDNPKRATMRCALGHAATYACEYCEAQAVLLSHSVEEATIKKSYELKIQKLNNDIEFLKESPGSVLSKERDHEKIKKIKINIVKLKKEKEKKILSIKIKRNLVWPYSTMSGILRTVDIIKYTVNRIKRNPDQVDKHERKGFKGESHLLYQRNFHFINSIPAEYMHLGCLGVTKRLLELTFKLTDTSREKNSKRKLSDPSLFNAAMKKIQFFREFSRRCRNLDLSIIKAQEYRNIILFFFMIVINCIEDGFQNEKRIWLYLAFIFRACVLPNNEFDLIDPIHVKNASKKFYSLFEKAFSKTNCTYSVHVFASHNLRIRGDKPFTETSAFKFESFYSEMKNLFQPGTNSAVKQIMQNTMMKRLLEPHCCNKPVKFACKKDSQKGLENNSMVYTLNEQNQHELYNIIEINEDGSFQCTKQGRFKYECPLTPEIDWSSVGVYKKGPSSLNIQTILKKHVLGKVISVEKFLITCPMNVLYEQ